MRTAVALALALSTIAACGPGSRNDGSGDDDGNGGADGGGGGGDNCADSAKFIYTVDENNQFSRWDATAKSFVDLGTLNCPDDFGTPFSMSVDRNTIAWVLYNDGLVFRVDINNNLACTATNWSTQNGLDVFGMGFSSNTAGSTDDTLFVAGGGDPTFDTSSTLAKLDTTSMSSTPVGTVTGWPELTGTGNAELWGFFPNANGSSTPRVEQIDKTSGQGVKTFNISDSRLQGISMAWAFAFWGGDFWIFLMTDADSATTVYQVDGTNGSIKGATPTNTRTIVGAGVSTCAPTVIL